MDFNFLSEKVATGENSTYLEWIFSGAMHTVAISFTAFILAMFIGAAVGTLRTTSGLSKRLADTFFETIRSIPFIAQLFIGFFVLPVLFIPETIKTIDPDSVVIFVGTLCLAVFMSARIAAQVTAGLQALPASQMMACKSMGFSQLHTYTMFLLPQALRNIIPTLTSEAMNTVKNSAVISTIGLMDLTKQSQQIIDYTAKPLEAFLCIVIGYLIINATVLMMMKIVEMKTRIN